MKRMLLLATIFLLVPVALALAGCSGADGATTQSDPGTAPPATSVQPTSATNAQSPVTAPPATQPAPNEETSTTEAAAAWVIYINDDDTYTEGDMTYNIALNLSATNPSSAIAGAYSGTATASTTMSGQLEGMPFNSSAVVNSTKLEFTLEDPLAGGALGTLTPTPSDQLVYRGSGTIVMQAAGTASVGPASGGFENTSGQTIEVTVTGSVATLSVVISGHKYTFEGTISGQ